MTLLVCRGLGPLGGDRRDHPSAEASATMSDRRPVSGGGSDKKPSSAGGKRTGSVPVATATGPTGGGTTVAAATGGTAEGGATTPTKNPPPDQKGPTRKRMSTSSSKDESEKLSPTEKGQKDSSAFPVPTKKPTTKAERRALQVCGLTVCMYSPIELWCCYVGGSEAEES